ncbi:MAG: porin [Nibricoccus sp.]
MILRSIPMAVLALLALPAFAAPTIEERLSELEKKVSALAAENAALKKELGYSKDGKPPVFVAPAGKETKLVLGGFIHANGEFGDVPDARWAGISNRFFLRRARLNATATFGGDFLAKVEADFGANTLGASSGLRAQLTDGYLQWNKYAFSVVKVGQFKTPFGFEQLASDTKTHTIERSLPNDRLTFGRQIGVGVSGDVVEKRISYSVGAFNGSGVNTTTNDNDQMMWAGRVSGLVVDTKLGDTPLKWSVGTNALRTRDTGTGTAFSGVRKGLGIDTQVAIGSGDIWAEWLRGENRTTAGVVTKAEGYSLLAAYRITPKWQGVVRYENYDSNTATTNTTTKVWTTGVNYLLRGEDLKLSLNYLIGDQPEGFDDGDRLIGRMQVLF